MTPQGAIRFLLFSIFFVYPTGDFFIRIGKRIFDTWARPATIGNQYPYSSFREE